MEKMRYEKNGALIPTSEALKVRADVLMPNSAHLHVELPDGTIAGMVSIAWNFANAEALEACGAALSDFIVQLRAHETASRQAANESTDSPPVQ